MRFHFNEINWFRLIWINSARFDANCLLADRERRGKGKWIIVRVAVEDYKGWRLNVAQPRNLFCTSIVVWEIRGCEPTNGAWYFKEVTVSRSSRQILSSISMGNNAKLILIIFRPVQSLSLSPQSPASSSTSTVFPDNSMTYSPNHSLIHLEGPLPR
jgi:hypothetical protein